jgi:hypothetical protein
MGYALLRAGDRQDVYLQRSINAETFCLSPAVVQEPEYPWETLIKLTT